MEDEGYDPFELFTEADVDFLAELEENGYDGGFEYILASKKNSALPLTIAGFVAYQSSKPKPDTVREISDSDVQDDFCITFNRYPFLKKYGCPEEEFKQPGFIHRLLPCDFMEFILDLTDNTFTPLFKYKLKMKQYAQLKHHYLENKELVDRYVQFQLANSGILDALRDIPVGETAEDFTLANGTVHTTITTTRITFALRISIKSLAIPLYHGDSTLFQLLQYFKSDSYETEQKAKASSTRDLDTTYVLGSEILLYQSPDTNLHSELIESTGVYPEKKTGPLIPARYEEIKTIYREITSRGIQPTLLRGVYRHADTLVWPDTLLKHAVINPKENRVDDIVHIEVSRGLGRSGVPVAVTVCSDRIRTTQEHYNGRGVVSLLFRISTQISDEDILDPVPILPVNVVNAVDLNSDQLKEMFIGLSTGQSCVTLSGGAAGAGGGYVVLKNRGGRGGRVSTRHRKTKIRRRSKNGTSKKRSRHSSYLRKKRTYTNRYYS